jgi:hypothetical protein
LRVLSVVALITAVAALAVLGPADSGGGDSSWPPSAAPAPGGIRVQLSTPASDDDRWILDVYRQRAPKRSSPARLPGSINYCLAVSLAAADEEKQWQGSTCGLSAAIALRVQRHGLRLDCGGVGSVLGAPAEPGPICGLVAADVQSVTVSAENGPVVAAELSKPFRTRFNRSGRILRHGGIDPAGVRALPQDFRMRAFLAFLPTAPTPPGERTPRLAISATRTDGSTLSRELGGGIVPVSPGPP